MFVWGQVGIQYRIKHLWNNFRDTNTKSHFSFHTIWSTSPVFPPKYPWDCLKPPQSAYWENTIMLMLPGNRTPDIHYIQRRFLTSIDWIQHGVHSWISGVFEEQIRHRKLITSEMMTVKELLLIPHPLTFLFPFSNKCKKILPLATILLFHWLTVTSLLSVASNWEFGDNQRPLASRREIIRLSNLMSFLQNAGWTVPPAGDSKLLHHHPTVHARDT